MGASRFGCYSIGAVLGGICNHSESKKLGSVKCFRRFVASVRDLEQAFPVDVPGAGRPALACNTPLLRTTVVACQVSPEADFPRGNFLLGILRSVWIQ